MKDEVFMPENGALRLFGERENYSSGVEVDDFVLTTESNDVVPPHNSNPTTKRIVPRSDCKLRLSDSVAEDLLSNAIKEKSFVHVQKRLADSDEWEEVCKGKVTLKAPGEYSIRCIR